MLEAAYETPEQVVEFSSHLDVKLRARSLSKFKSGKLRRNVGVILE